MKKRVFRKSNNFPKSINYKRPYNEVPLHTSIRYALHQLVLDSHCENDSYGC